MKLDNFTFPEQTERDTRDMTSEYSYAVIFLFVHFLQSHKKNEVLKLDLKQGHMKSS